MNFLSFAILPMLIIANGSARDILDDSLVNQQEDPERIMKREASSSKLPDKQKSFYGFVEDKLVEHSQALEHLVKLVNEAVGALNNLVENLGRSLEEPKLPERIEGELEQLDRSAVTDESRRFYWGKPLKFPSFFNFKTGSSPWCSVALLCHRTRMTVCGYDDNFGYGKFDDMCHLIQVNCYWKYNFALVPSCRPSLWGKN